MPKHKMTDLRREEANNNSKEGKGEIEANEIENNNQLNTDIIQRLPDEILFHIFGFFSSRKQLLSARLVSKRFKKIASDNQLLSLFPIVDYSKVKNLTSIKINAHWDSACLSHKADLLAFLNRKYNLYGKDSYNIEILDLTTGQLLNVSLGKYICAERYPYIYKLSFTKDDGFILITDVENSKIDVWDIKNKTLSDSYVLGENFSSREYTSCLTALSNNKIIISFSSSLNADYFHSSWIEIHDMNTKKLISSHVVGRIDVNAISVSTDNSMVAFVDRENNNHKNIQIFSTETLKFIKKITIDFTIGDLLFLPDNKHIVVSLADDDKKMIFQTNKIQIVNIETNKVSNTITLDEKIDIRRFFISKNGKYIALNKCENSAKNSIIEILDRNNLNCLGTIDTNTSINTIFFNSKGNTIIYGDKENIYIASFNVLDMKLDNIETNIPKPY